MTQLSQEMTATAIAAELPGAAELFRQRGINFYCGGNIALSEAALRAGLLPDVMIVHPIAQMRHEHDDTARLLAGIEHAAHGLSLPEGACGSWTALYTGLRKVSEDLVVHMHLESNVLFTRYEPVRA